MAAENPGDVFQDWLDRRTRSWMTGDFEANLDLCKLPMTINTSSAVIVVRTPSDLQSGFDAWRRMIHQQSVDTIIASLVSVVEATPDRISGIFDTRIMRGVTQICAPFRGKILLVRSDDDAWRVTHADSGLSNQAWPFTVPRPAA